MSRSQAQTIVCSTKTLSNIADRFVKASGGAITKRQALNMFSAGIAGDKHDFGYLVNASAPIVAKETPEAVKLLFDTIKNPRLEDGSLTAELLLEDSIELEVGTKGEDRFDSAKAKISFFQSGVSLEIPEIEGPFKPVADIHLSGGDLYVQGAAKHSGGHFDPVVTRIPANEPMDVHHEGYEYAFAQHFPSRFVIQVEEKGVRKSIPLHPSDLSKVFQTLRASAESEGDLIRLETCNLYVKNGEAHFLTGPGHHDKFHLRIPASKALSAVMEHFNYDWQT